MVCYSVLVVDVEWYTPSSPTNWQWPSLPKSKHFLRLQRGFRNWASPDLSARPSLRWWVFEPWL